jgi:hypothetical protein
MLPMVPVAQQMAMATPDHVGWSSIGRTAIAKWKSNFAYGSAYYRQVSVSNGLPELCRRWPHISARRPKPCCRYGLSEASRMEGTKKWESAGVAGVTQVFVPSRVDWSHGGLRPLYQLGKEGSLYGPGEFCFRNVDMLEVQKCGRRSTVISAWIASVRLQARGVKERGTASGVIERKQSSNERTGHWPLETEVRRV